MFGETLDYMILRSIAHKRNIATEEELNTRANQEPLSSINNCVTRLRKHIERFEGLFPISSDLRYLDIGCGNGELTIALAKLGCRHVTGIDIVPRNIATCEFFAGMLGLSSAVQFICKDIYQWVPPEKYDVLLSFDAFEHIDSPRHFMQKMADLLAPDGIAVLAFGPLFHSPFGDHMGEFFRVQIPWRGVLFPEKAILRVRRDCYRPTDAVERYKDIVGGLNQMRYSEFLRYIHETGWHFSFLALNPSLKRLPLFHYMTNTLAQIPLIKDYFVSSVYAILRRSPLPSQHG